MELPILVDQVHLKMSVQKLVEDSVVERVVVLLVEAHMHTVVVDVNMVDLMVELRKKNN